MAAIAKTRHSPCDYAHRRFADPKRRTIVPSDLGIWEISDEIPAQLAASRGGSLAGCGSPAWSSCRRPGRAGAMGRRAARIGEIELLKPIHRGERRAPLFR